MICDRAERRVGGTSAPVFGGGFLGFPRKAGYLIGGILPPSRKNGFMIGAADGGCAALLFIGLTLPGSPPPLRGSAAFFGAAGLQGRFNYRGDFYPPPARMAL